MLAERRRGGGILVKLGLAAAFGGTLMLMLTGTTTRGQLSQDCTAAATARQTNGTARRQKEAFTLTYTTQAHHANAIEYLFNRSRWTGLLESAAALFPLVSLLLLGWLLTAASSLACRRCRVLSAGLAHSCNTTGRRWNPTKSWSGWTFPLVSTRRRQRRWRRS